MTTTLLFFLLNLLLLAWLGWGAVYQFVFALAGVFYKNDRATARRATEPTTPEPTADNDPKIAVFIPAYREDAVILHTAAAALRQDYPSARYEVVVVADGLQRATLNRLESLPLRVVEVSFEKSTKAKALNCALDVLENEDVAFDLAVVLDADNVMVPDFLRRVAERSAAGARALQGRRAAKNSQSAFALLDGASEDANNHILCRGHRALGLSARLAGSGMAFDYGLFRRVMPLVDAVGGFDKELELRLTQLGERIEYDENAVVLDEKVSRPEVFTRQRSRWMAAQFRYAKLFLPRGAWALLRHGNLDFFNKSVQMALPPRLILPALLAFGFLANALVFSAMAWLWAAALILNVAAFALALPRYCFEPKNLLMWAHLPRALGASLLALTRLGEASRRFLVTPKTVSATMEIA